jgi:hypothetical protein
MPQTFTNSEQVLQYLQQTYGSANYSQWQSLRKQFYSFINYPAAGSTQLNFFGYSVSGTAGQNTQYTNMPKAGSFGQQHFLLKSIACVYYLSSAQSLLNMGSAVDTQNVSADLLHGFAQAGVLTLDIGAKSYAQIPRPFLYAPPGDGEINNVSLVHNIFTLTEGTPNTLLTSQSLVTSADLNRDSANSYIVDPGILIEAEQAFNVQIQYPSGAIPLIASGKLTTNFFVGVILDGVLFRPVQ